MANAKHEATLTPLGGKTPNATNSINNPENIVPVSPRIELNGPKFEREFDPDSINVIDIERLE
ncbi:MAG: hypothetical protein ACLP00_06770 [Terracidiphilus sp.]